MSLNVMTIDEINEVSGGMPFFPNPSWWGMGMGIYSAWGWMQSIHFGYADMRGNYYPYP